MPVLGIIASSASPNAFANSYESIATVTIGSGGASTASFTSIPATYQHLQIRILAKTGDAGAYGSASMTINGGAGEQRHELYGTGAATGSGANASSFLAYVGGTAQFGVAIVDILDYADANKAKTTRGLGGTDNNGSGIVALTSGLETTTTAISSLTFTANSGNFAEYSSFALYGIKS